MPKFIVNKEQIVTSNCDYHREIAKDHSTTQGGGQFKIDFRNKRVFLYGKSDEFGVCKRTVLEDLIEKEAYTLSLDGFKFIHSYSDQVPNEVDDCTILNPLSDKEKELISQSLEFLNLNKGIALTGSLMMAFRKIDKPRDATSADFIFDDSISLKNLKVPEGTTIKEVSNELCNDAIDDSQHNSFTLEFLGNTFNFYYSDEDYIEVNGVNCADISWMLSSKFTRTLYADCKNEREKNTLDLEFYQKHYILAIKEQVDGFQV